MFNDFYAVCMTILLLLLAFHGQLTFFAKMQIRLGLVHYYVVSIVIPMWEMKIVDRVKET